MPYGVRAGAGVTYLWEFSTAFGRFAEARAEFGSGAPLVRFTVERLSILEDAFEEGLLSLVDQSTLCRKVR